MVAENCIFRPFVEVLALLPKVDWITPKVALGILPDPTHVFPVLASGATIPPGPVVPRPIDVELQEKPCAGLARLGVLKTL